MRKIYKSAGHKCDMIGVKQFLAMLLLALSGDKTHASPEQPNQVADPIDPKPTLEDTPTAVLFEAITDSRDRHLTEDKSSGFFPNSAKQTVAFQTPEQLVANSGLSNLSFTKDGLKMGVVKHDKHKIKHKNSEKRNLRGNQNESSTEDEIEQEYTTVAMSSDDGKAYASCAVYPDGKRVACLQYIHNGVQNTTLIMVDPNDLGSHTLTTVTPNEQREYFKDHNKMEPPVKPAHDDESRRRALLEKSVPESKSLHRNTAAIMEATMAAAVDPDTLNAFGGMENAKAQIAIQVSILNQVLQNSGLNLQIKLVSVIKNPVNSNGDSGEDLAYATNNIDRGDADFLMSIVGNYGSSRSYQYNYKPADVQTLKKQLVSVVRYRMFPGKTFQHEFGHAIGGQHQPQYAYTTGRRFPNAYAWSDIDEIIGTLLAYIYNPVDRIPQYSDPGKVVDNVQIGAPNLNNVGGMKVTTPEIFGMLRGQSGSAPTPMPTVAVYTAAPNSKAPSKKPTKKPTRAPVGTEVPTTVKTTATKTPTKQPVITRHPSVKPSKAPTKPRTFKPTRKPTAAPTFDQTPLLPVNKLVDFTFDVDANAPNIPLTIQIGAIRKVTIKADGSLTVLNNANTAVGKDNYLIDSDVLNKVKQHLNSGSSNKFRIINTGTEVNLYYVPLVPKKIDGKIKLVSGTPQLLLDLHKISTTGNNMLGDNLQISFGKNTAKFIDVGAIRNVATSKPITGRLLADETEPDAVINFIEFAKNPEGETNKFLSGEYDSVLKVIAGSSHNILKFIDDATFNLGEKEAYKLMSSGVMSKIFDLAGDKNLRKVFKQLHSYHKIEFIQYVNERLIAQDAIFNKAAVMRSLNLKFGAHDTSDGSSRKSTSVKRNH